MNDKSNILSGLMPRQTVNSGYTTSNQANDKENAHNIRLTGNLPTSGTHSGKATSSSAGTGKQHKLKQRFTVIRKLGKGTYGKVQLAINKKTGQEVAIKTIKKTKIETEQDLQRVKREIQIMSSIEHPHIIHIYEVFENKDKIVLVMQYAPGGELFEYVSQSKTLDDNEARRLFRQIATAIYYCHQNKICHRDLKLENILLDEKNNAKLADFGLSNVFDKQRQLSTFCGSPLYASPEIVQGSPYEGPEVDCWSLGVLLYTLVYGAMPFDGSNFKRLVKQISEACYFEPKQRSLASPLIRRLLCADPACRATILDICADPWVNNMLPTSPLGSHLPITESGQQQQQAHNSLLKVAQDMANLTPVRFDILLALIPSSTNAPQTNARNRPPLARIPDRATDCKGSGPTSDAARQQRESLTLALGPTRIMEVDETRASSPVASYIVRDLDVEQRHEQDQEIGERETGQLSMEAHQTEISADSSLKETSDQNMSVLIASDKAENDEPSEMQTDSHKTEVPSKEQHPVSEQPVEELTEGSDAEPVKEETRDQVVHVSEPKIDDEEVKMEVDATHSQVLEQAEQLGGETKVPQETNGTEISKKDATEKPDVVGEEGKPKKVKKKIVVVKKKKKVPKKDNELDSSKTEKEVEGPDKTPQRKKSGDKQQVDPQQQKTTKVGSKSPGKVRIPNTFQATNDNKEPPVAARTGAEGRRPSALVVDVSQKLLMQQQQQQPSPTPAQVPNVRVADKKNEFERRASLASAQVQLVSGSGKSSSQELVDESATKEPELVEHQVLCEVLNQLGQIEQTIVEPVVKIQALQIGPATVLNPPTATDQQSSYESQTPTGSANTHNDEDAKRRLAGWTCKLDEVRRKNSQQRISLDSGATSPDNRSDSAETLKPDAVDSPLVQDTIRSSLQISMKGPETTQRELQMGAPRADITAVGPAPITRSYKKVTFTKDGACVTETGKIYSAQCDDGTVRRIERKSKITHYPAGDSLTGSATSISERKREVAFESGKIGDRSSWQSSFQGKKSSSTSIGPPQLRPFEKLIMPSTGIASSMLAAQLTEDDDDMDELGSEFTRRRSLFSRQSRGRADSDASSCSSGSTDVFDDIFDTWTGAISMFNQNNNNRNLMRRLGSGSLMDPVDEPLFNDSPMSGFRSMFNRRTGRHSAQDGSQRTSDSGVTPRCGSVEPRQMRGKGRHKHERWPAAGVETSGYESDAPVDRPASALAGNLRTRQGFGGLFSNETDDVFGGDLLRDLEQEHENLKQRLAERHRQLWKGSTPSLLTSADPDLFHDTTHKPAQPRTKPPHSNLWPREDVEQGRQEREVTPHRPRSSSGSQSCSLHQQQSHCREPTWPRHADEGARNASLEGQQVGQSHSSSSFLRQSIALDPSPIRRNNANLPAEHQLPPRQIQPIRRSISKTSLTTGQVDNSEGKQMTSEKHSACFIQLKRTSSGQQENSQKQNVESLVTSTTSAKLISSKSGATSCSSALNREGGELDPVSVTTSNGTQQVSGSTGESCKQMESRIQSWLQESSGNLSASSGSKSSISTEATSAQNDNNLKNKLETLPHATVTLGNLPSQSDDGLPFKIGGSSSSQIRKSADSTIVKSSGTKQQIVKHSTSSTIVVTSSSSKQSISNLEQGQRSAVEHRRQQVVTETRDSGLDTLLNEPLSATSSSTRITSRSGLIPKPGEKFPTTVNEEEDDDNYLLFDGSQQRHRNISQSSSFSARVSPSINSPNVIKNTESGLLNWTTIQQQQRESTRRLFTGEEVDSQSGAGSADLESHSSSSLLDQLKSRGYRSMINQRNQEQVTSTTSCASTSLVESTSRSVVASSSVISGGESTTTTNLVQQQVFTSSSSTAKGLLEEPDAQAVGSTMDQSEGLGEQNHVQQVAAAQNGFGTHTVDADCATVEGPEDKDFRGAPNNEEEDEDEDVREAKANIKSYLDSVKETEKFLKSIQQDEENLERQRQQLYLFNNLILSTKLGGVKAPTEIRSAPIRSAGYPPSNGFSDIGSAVIGSQDVHLKGFIPSTSLSFEPNYTVPDMQCNSTYTPSVSSARYHQLNLSHPVSGDAVDPPIYQHPSVGYCAATATDPLEPVQPLTISHDLIGRAPSSFLAREGRSRSQLSDQFVSYKSRRSRPLSANIQDLAKDDNVYFPSRSKRSLSQIRYSDQVSVLGGRPSRYSTGEQPMMSEYMSAYGRSPVEPSQRQLGVSLEVPRDNKYNGLSDSTEGEDDDMSVYRASAYVPKVVPQGMPARGRAYKRTGSAQASSGLSEMEFSSNDPEKPIRERRISLQPQGKQPGSISRPTDKKDGEDTSPETSRRRSMTDVGANELMGQPNSRLSELEQRIQANKRRREELLAGRLSPQPAASIRFDRPEDELTLARRASQTREVSPQPRTSVGRASGASKLMRPSRLESMEARIKRKSYCVRMGECSPERGQFQRGGSQELSLEKWRSQVSSASGVSSSSSLSLRGSLLSGSIRCDLLPSETKRKLSGESSLEQDNRWNNKDSSVCEREQAHHDGLELRSG